MDGCALFLTAPLCLAKFSVLIVGFFDCVSATALYSWFLCELMSPGDFSSRVDGYRSYLQRGLKSGGGFFELRSLGRIFHHLLHG